MKFYLSHSNTESRRIRWCLNLTIVTFLFSNSFQAQQPSVGFSRSVLSPLEKKLNHKNADVHSNIQPAAYGLEPMNFVGYDTVEIAIRKKSICVGPIGNISSGYQIADKSQALGYGNLGLDIKYTGNPHWSAGAGYLLAGGILPNYLNQIADSIRVLPGYGYAVRDGNNLHHNHYSYGHLSYSNGKHFQFEIGKGKHFWGDGYRSLILSDNSAPFPYARITTKVWKLKYTNLWMQMRDLSFGQPRKDARVKYAAMHALSFNATKKFNFSIYEMVVWQDRDTMSQRTLDINYLNPIIFYRPVEYSVGSPDNVILAASMKLRLKPWVQFYGQFVLDEFNLKQFQNNQKWWANKLGGQLGVKLFDVIIPGLNIQSEANVARPFTYTHGSPIQSWTNLNQPLAHPMGANFIEWVNFVRYDWKEWSVTEQFTWAAFGRDNDQNGDGIIDNMGGNILRSYKDPYGGQYGHEILQGLKSNFYFHSLMISRKLKQNSAFEVFLNHTLRYEENEVKRKVDNFVVIGIRATGLLQPTIDF
jgi:hypothetical protein